MMLPNNGAASMIKQLQEGSGAALSIFQIK